MFLVCSRWSQYGKYFFLISRLVRTLKTWYWQHTCFEATATAGSISLVFAYVNRNWCPLYAAAIATKAFPTLLPCPPPLSNCSFYTVSAPISCSIIPSYLYGAVNLPLPCVFWLINIWQNTTDDRPAARSLYLTLTQKECRHMSIPPRTPSPS